MSRIIASAAIRGAYKYVKEAEEKLNRLIEEKGEKQEIGFPNTAYYLPLILALLGIEVKTLAHAKKALEQAKSLLPPVPLNNLWLPYLGDTLDAGIATLIAEEIIEALKYLTGDEPKGIWLGFTDDTTLRTQGIKLVDGRMPGFAACVGALPTNEEAVELARALQEKNILVFMSSSTGGKSMAEQLAEEGIEMNWDTFLVPYGKDTSATVHALNFAARAAMTFGGIKPGDLEKARQILLYNKERVHAFVLALGADPEVNGSRQLITDEKYATAAGAINFGFPTLSDVDIPQILPTGICTYEHVVSSIPLDKIVSKAIEVRGLEIKVTEIPIPVPYGAGFEGERVRKEQMWVQFGGKYSEAFELLRGRPMDEVEDGKIELIGPDVDSVEEGGAMPLGILVEVAGRNFSEDFETVLERRIHEFLSCANGIFHMGQRAIIWVRISKDAYQKGFRLRHFGEILIAKIHDEFSGIVDKVQVKIITDEEKIKQPLEEAKIIYHQRDERLGGMTDEDVDEYFSCILCVPEGENILLPDGSFQSVENLFDEASFEFVLSLNSHDFQAQPVEELFLNPAPSKLVKITLSNGNTLSLTPNHSVLVDRKEGLKWLKARELKLGDWLISPLTTIVDRNIKKNFYVIDFLSPEVKVCDEEALSILKELILKKYKTLGEGAHQLGIDYQKLYHALRIGETIARRRLSLREVRLICEKVRICWNEFKTKIKKLGIGKGCRLNKNILDEEISYLAGLVASDGSIIKRGKSSYVQFTNAEKTLVDRFGQIVHNWLGVYPRVYEVEPVLSISKEVEVRGKKKVFVCHVHNPLLGQILMGLGIREDEGWSGEKISSLSPDLVASFVRGIFDGDGHVTKDHVLISTGSYKEAQHIHLLLKKLRISSYITKTTRGYQVGTRSFNDLERFRSLISSHHPVKLQKMEGVVSHRDKNHVIRTDTVPYLCGRLIENLIEKYQKKLQITKLSVDYKTIKNWVVGKHRISREKLKLLLDDLKEVVDPQDQDYRELLSWYNSRVSFERIKDLQEVKYSRPRVYNFSVKDTHNYLVNGVVVKNCQSYAPNHVCIVTPERLGLCGAYTWLDCKASHQINPHGPNEPVKKGKTLDPVKGQWEGVNEYLKVKSNGNLERFNAYSMLEDPMTSCVVGDTEVVIDGKSVKIRDFVDYHWGKEDYTKSSALTLKEGKAKEDPVVAMQKFPAPQRLIKLHTKSGAELILTPNHEIAVDRWERLGWIRADEIKVGDHIISLAQLDLPSNFPEIVDILPDDFRVADQDLIEEIKNHLISKYGSLRKALTHIPVKLSSGTKSIKIGDLKTIVFHLGIDWNKIKRQIKIVNVTSSFIRLPERLSEDIFYLMGLIASDGSITRRGRYEYHIDFINTNEKLGEVFTSIYWHTFSGRNIGVVKKKKTISKIRERIIKPTKSCLHYYLNNPVLGYLCKYFGIPTDHNSRWNLGKMLSLPKSHIAAFLAGLFDGDGSVRLRKYQDKWEIGEGYLCIFDKDAARHLQLLLKRLGIVGNLRKDSRVWKIELHGKNLSQFALLVPSKHPQKQKLLRRISQLAGSKDKLDKSQREVLPYHVGRAVAALAVSQRILSPTTLFYYKTGRSRPVTSNVQKVLQKDVLPKPEEKKFRNLLETALNTDYYLDAVIHKEEIENRDKYDYVYNLTLKNVHAYFVNGGCLIKNCGCFECICAILPEANGVMIVNREFTGMTPVGMTFSTMAGQVGGGVQTPGFIGIGKMYITSKKFISADGGIKRVVWMPAELKEEIRERLQQRLEEIGEPDLMEKIATEKDATTSEELLEFLQKKNHPALSMPPMM